MSALRSPTSGPRLGLRVGLGTGLCAGLRAALCTWLCTWLRARSRALLFALGCAALLGGCTTIEKVESGEQVLGERLVLKLEGPWNRVDLPGPFQVWTMEGLPVDQLRIFSGLRDGQPVVAGARDGSPRKPLVFRASMQPEQVVALFEGMMTRDGSVFTLKKLEPAPFGGVAGFRFEFTLTRKVDGVELQGLAHGAIADRALYAVMYSAPRLVFYARHAPGVEAMARQAVLRQGAPAAP